MRPWIVPLALSLACAMLGAALWPLGWVSHLLMGLGGLFVLWALVLTLPKLRPRDRYDLGLLKEVHEKEELRAVEEEEGLDYNGIVCLCCGTNYNPRLPVCPRCGRSAG